MTFQIHALSYQTFAHLFSQPDSALKEEAACREVVTAHPGTPCRVSLADAEVGETVILLNYAHQPADSPYRASHAIYVRENAQNAELAVCEVPQVLQSRLISVRLFDADHMMIDADVVDGRDLSEKIPAAFDNAAVDYIHLHYAKPGCFAASVTRA